MPFPARTWIQGELVTPLLMNGEIRDNITTLRGGGISIASQAVGDIIITSSATQFDRLPGVAAGQFLASGGVGVAPAYDANFTTSTIPRKGIAETITQPWIFSNPNTGFTLTSTAPGFDLRDTDQGLDLKNSRIVTSGGRLRIQMLNDALSVIQTETLHVFRSGGIYIGNTSVDPGLNNFQVQGSIIGSGASLTSLNAGNISSGNLAFARLPSGTGTWDAVVTLDGSMTITSDLVVSGGDLDFGVTQGRITAGTDVSLRTGAGFERLNVDASRILSTVAFSAPDGQASSPAYTFSGATTSGMYRSGDFMFVGQNLSAIGSIAQARYARGAAPSVQFIVGDGVSASGGMFIIAFNDNQTTNIRPFSDNVSTCGTAANRWSDVRSVLINGADYCFDNRWTLTEHDRVGISEAGVALLDEDNNLVAFFGKHETYLRNLKSVEDLVYRKTTQEERVTMAVTK